MNRKQEIRMLKADSEYKQNHPSDVTNDFIKYVFKKETNNMTAMEQFKNDLKMHLGQQKLLLMPELQKHLEAIYELQSNLLDALLPKGSSLEIRPNYLMPFIDDVSKFIKPLKDLVRDNNGRLDKSDDTKDNANKVIDGAYYINFMNVANQLFFYENQYLKNLPKDIKNEYLYEVTKAKDIIDKYGAELIWVEKHSSYDHTLSIFDFEDINGADGQLPTKQILDKPVSK